MNLNAKVTFFFAGMVGLLVVALVAISLYAFRSFSISTATDHMRTAAEIVRVHLTESMINGTINKREGFLNRLLEVQGLKSARVIRSPLVEKQFGKGLKQESEIDDNERDALREGKPQFGISDVGDDLIFRGTIPYIASASGTPNCLQCHQVEEGSVLGAITISMSINALKDKALLAISGIVGAVAFFSVLLIVLVRRMLNPVSTTAHAIEEAVHKALDGDFKSHVKNNTDDEIGHIAADMNRLLTFLDDGLNRIGKNVARLTGRTPSPDENLLTATIDMVDGLTKAAHFKQAIEEDETKDEIYQRLSATLGSEFNLKEFSIYELNHHKHQMEPVIVDGQFGGECRWCDEQILIRPEACRARRTGHMVDGVTNPAICYSFRPPEGSEYQHICFPIMQSGSVGSVLQLVAAPGERRRLLAIEPYVNVYLREASPVLETKRLMETLREANLRDPMTGLNNRRFLEEYVETLVANVQRKKAHLAILMLDLDYFKMVNDTHGHDAGDAVLKALAKVLKQTVRSSDMVIRYGGEEFLIILQEAEGNNADRVAENIRIAVESIKTQVGSIVIQKTISIGIADFPTDSDTFWQTVKYADIALYRAKEEGRNRVVRFNTSMWTGNKDY